MSHLLSGNLDYNGNQALNMILHSLTADPSYVAGKFYYNSNSGVKRPRWCDGSVFYDIYPFNTANTASTAVLRDSSGNFSAGTISAALSGNASTATALQTPRALSITGKATAAGQNFDGTGAIALSVSALSVVPGDIALNSGYVMIGNGSNVAAAALKSAILLSDLGAPTGAVSMNSQNITNLADPVNPQDAMTYGLAQTLLQGLDPKSSVRVLTTSLPSYTRTGNVLTASSNGALPAQDSVTLIVGDSFCYAPGTSVDAGLYTVTTLGGVSSTWSATRRNDFDTSAKVTPGATFYVEDGTNYGGNVWFLVTKLPITLNTTSLLFSQYSGASLIIATYPLVKSGNTLSINYDASTIKLNGSNQLYVDTSVISATALKSDIAALSVIGNPTNATSAPSIMTAASDGQVMRRSGTTVAFGALLLSGANAVTGTLGVANGGTGIATAATNGIPYGAGTGAFGVTAAGSQYQTLQAGASGVPVFAALSLGQAAAVTGQLGAANGGTGLATVTTNGIPYGAGTGALGVTAAGTQYQPLQAGASGVPIFAALDLGQSASTTGTLPVNRGGSGLTSTSQNFAFIGPTSGAGAPTWRALVSGDIPSLSALYLPLGGGTLTGTLTGTNGTFSGTVTAATLTGNIQGNALSLSQVTTALGGTPSLMYATTITGDGSTTAFTITHNLGTRALIPSQADAATPYASWIPDVTFPTTNTATFSIVPAPANGKVFNVGVRT